MAKKCKICKQNYNLTNKKPIVINECFCTHCLECLEDLMRGNNERKIIYCKFTIHIDHQLTDLKQSKFKIYTTNVKSMFDEYSVQNMVSQLDNQASNEIQQTASQFKSMVSKVSRMLGHLAKDEERSKICLPTCLGEPKNDPQNVKRIPKILGKIIQRKNQSQISLQDIKHLINESQSLLREEFKQALDVFESSQRLKERVYIDQSNKRINSVQSTLDQQLPQFQLETKSGLEIRPNEIEEDVVNQKLKAIDQKYTKLSEQMQEIKGVFQIENKFLNDQIAEIHAKTDSIKKFTKDQINQQANQLLKFQQQIKSLEPNSNNNYIPNASPITQTIDQNMQINIDNAFDQMKHNFRILVDEEINQTNQSLLKPQFASIKNKNFIKDDIDKKFSLLFRGSTHGFTASQFHNLCDKKGPTVSFILSEFGHVFGGYASDHLRSTDKDYRDYSAFIFSLRGTYELPKEQKFRSYEAQSYLAGQLYFKVLEIEGYSLI
eukprot:403346848